MSILLAAATEALSYFIDRREMDRVVNGVLLELPTMDGNCVEVTGVDICGAFGALPILACKLFHEP